MKYEMKIDTSKTTSPYINLRSLPSTSGVDIGDLRVGDIAQGDVIVKDSLGQDWLDVLSVNGLAVSTKTYAITKYCSLTELPVLPPVSSDPDIRVDIEINSDSTLRCIVYSNGNVVSDNTVPFSV